MYQCAVPILKAFASLQLPVAWPRSLLVRFIFWQFCFLKSAQQWKAVPADTLFLKDKLHTLHGSEELWSFWGRDSLAAALHAMW